MPGGYIPRLEILHHWFGVLFGDASDILVPQTRANTFQEIWWLIPGLGFNVMPRWKKIDCWGMTVNSLLAPESSSQIAGWSNDWSGIWSLHAASKLILSWDPINLVSILTASHEIDGVRKEKERLTAAWTSQISSFGQLLDSWKFLKVNKHVRKKNPESLSPYCR